MMFRFRKKYHYRHFWGVLALCAMLAFLPGISPVFGGAPDLSQRATDAPVFKGGPWFTAANDDDGNWANINKTFDKVDGGEDCMTYEVDLKLMTNLDPVVLTEQKYDVVLMIDISGSMGENYVAPTTETRHEAAKKAVIEFVYNMVDRSPESSVYMVFYSGGDEGMFSAYGPWTKASDIAGWTVTNVPGYPTPNTGNELLDKTINWVDWVYQTGDVKAAGETDIYFALQLTDLLLDSKPGDNTPVILLLSDGTANYPFNHDPYVDDDGDDQNPHGVGVNQDYITPEIYDVLKSLNPNCDVIDYHDGDPNEADRFYYCMCSAGLGVDSYILAHNCSTAVAIWQAGQIKDALYGKDAQGNVALKFFTVGLYENEPGALDSDGKALETGEKGTDAIGQDTLKKIATNEDNYYFYTNGNNLSDIFKKIANRLFPELKIIVEENVDVDNVEFNFPDGSLTLEGSSVVWNLNDFTTVANTSGYDIQYSFNFKNKLEDSTYSFPGGSLPVPDYTDTVQQIIGPAKLFVNGVEGLLATAAPPSAYTYSPYFNVSIAVDGLKLTAEPDLDEEICGVYHDHDVLDEIDYTWYRITGTSSNLSNIMPGDLAAGYTNKDKEIVVNGSTTASGFFVYAKVISDNVLSSHEASDGVSFETVTLDLVGTKEAKYGALTNNQFSFSVSEVVGAGASNPQVATGTNDADGKITFSSITLPIIISDNNISNRFEFKVSEVKPLPAGWVLVSSEELSVFVEVTKNSSSTGPPVVTFYQDSSYQSQSIISDLADYLTFKNEYRGIAVTKKVSGSNLPATWSFEFALFMSDDTGAVGAKIASTAVIATNSVPTIHSFFPEFLTDGEHYFVLRETTASGGGWTTDTTEYWIKVNAIDGDEYALEYIDWKKRTSPNNPWSADWEGYEYDSPFEFMA